MKYKLRSLGGIYSEEEVNKLKLLGFEFEKRGDDDFDKIVKDVFIEINSIDDLKNLIKNHGKIIMNEYEIIIYDDFIE